MKSKDLHQIFRLLAMVSQIGLMIVASIGVGFFIGYLLDGLIGFKFLFTPLFIIMGVGAGFWSVYKILRDTMSNSKKDE